MPRQGPLARPVTWRCDHGTVRRARAHGLWADGKAVGRGHSSPCLQRKYAEDIVAGAKTVEGRVCHGFAKDVAVGDWLNFLVTGSGGGRLICRVLQVTKHDTFRSMLECHGAQSCLPGAVSVDEGVSTYHAFRTGGGATYEALAITHGVVAFVISPILEQGPPVPRPRVRRPRWKAGVLRLL